jgi:hypothetical protein
VLASAEAAALRIPEDYEQRAQDYDARRSRQLAVRVLSIIDVDAQITANAATWLDRDLIAESRVCGPAEAREAPMTKWEPGRFLFRKSLRLCLIGHRLGRGPRTW